MITNILFVVPGEPYGKGRARSTKSGRHYTPEKTVSYERLVGWTAKQAMGSKQPLSGALMVHVEAFCSVPTSWSKKKQADALAHRIRPTSVPDWDNIAKIIGDGCNGVVWVDDKQIVSGVVTKHYSAAPSVRVSVADIASHP